MKVRFKKLFPKAIAPTKAHSSDAGFDLYVASRNMDDYDNVVYGSGVAVEIPEGYVGLLFPRSSNAKKSLLLSNSVGVIDSGYRGEITAKFRKTYARQIFRRGVDIVHDYGAEYRVGDRFVQLIIIPYPQIEFEEVEELSESERGTGGYGSSGR